jgi:hypothetical protein
LKQDFAITAAILLIFGIAACSPVIPAPMQEAAPAEPFHPLTTETGIETIDQVLSAVSNGDTEALRSLAEFTNAKCTQQDGLGGPPKCREGEAEGTPVEVLAFLSSEGSFLRKEEIGDWQGIDVSGVYAVYEVSPAVTSEQYYPLGKYVIVFVSEEDRPAVALRLGERGIVRVDHIFDSSPEILRALVEREASQVILAPKT